MTANGSMALWCSMRQDQQAATIEAHFNYWRISGDIDFKNPNGTPIKDFFEIGVMVNKPHSVEKINIYLPLLLKNFSVQDCGPFFNKTNIAQGIFNEVLACTVPGLPGPRYVELSQGSSLFCRIHNFTADGDRINESELSMQTESGGTLLTITRQAIDEVCRGLISGGKAYFRLRLYFDAKQSPFLSVVLPRDYFLNSGFDEVEYIDFRLNEARTLPQRIDAMMRQDEINGKVSIRLIAFLTAVPVLAELSVSNTQWHKNRLLEHKIWNDYVPSGIPNGMMVYHWKKLADSATGINDFSSFVKIQTRRSSRRTLKLYLTFAFVFGVLGNLAASFIIFFI